MLLDPWLSQFLQHLTSRNSAYTLRNYRRALFEFKRWYQKDRKDGPAFAWDKLKRFDFRTYLHSLGLCKIGRSSTQIRFAALRSFYKYLMQQRLLTERFGLQAHFEKKDMTVYELTVAKGGPKLKEVDPAAPPALPPAPPGTPPPPGSAGAAPRGPGMRIMMGTTSRRMTGSTTLTRMCEMLSNFLDRPVVDLTELKGTYEIDLAWTPDENEMMGGKLATSMAMARNAAPPPPPGGREAPAGHGPR